MKIAIYIPTMGRFDRQYTWAGLPKQAQKNTLLVCPPDEVKEYQARGYRAVGCPAKGITPTRDWCMDHAHRNGAKKMVMLDDDITIQRRVPKGIKIVNATEEQKLEAFAWLESTLDEVAHCGWSIRTANFRDMAEERSPTRMMYCLAYHVPTIKRVGARFMHGLENYSTMEDFNMTLQLLTMGLTNRVSLLHRLTARTSNADGGCSTWRTTPRQTESAKRLAEMFPGLVRVREKKAWRGMKDGMMDVTVYWQKALAVGLEKSGAKGAGK